MSGNASTNKQWEFGINHWNKNCFDGIWNQDVPSSQIGNLNGIK
jgi:hypothetical protein